MSLDRIEGRSHLVGAQKSVVVRVALDDSIATRGELDAYFKVVDEHDAAATGHDTGRKKGTSTIIFRSEFPITKREMQKALDEVRVISVRTVQD
ncbi:hypothetical protein A2V56_03800 [Candidatus Woesebacteria bacterium RBG_19FT_COMBO_42_9]|uniref:Uncharacterized protein n=1 Tax=Candidatus Woesebacteria bacterium RBG_16_42_24 TaxID=1802485 RepID=A0A1F7XMI4_9BACT|nr:MAG: hypothetical protein A2V97_00440 [Candidatus Woesebacteria bacterium RBG_16_42_24]OGM17590.1 MAG: hypothetical protein A2V56_03800 [Candidatus Woesebacteria bacterium RBG_19FT_COMBO_42_9]OGM67097.1 MAG: hypothetical protein A2985_02485 [Candidatus Woesebacteria bacterium RIFCSPLOWO2_01_FULL_43_11]